MSLFVAIVLFSVGVLHLLPSSGALGAHALARIYGLDATDATVLLLLRHRAVLFGLLGVGLCASAFIESARAPALVAGHVSVLSFLALARAHPKGSPAIDRVVRADLVAEVALVVATALYAIDRG